MEKLQPRHYWLILVSVFLLYVTSPVITVSDSRYNTHTAYSLIKHGDVNLDEFDIPPNDYRIETIKGHRYSFFPVWPALILTGPVWLGDRLLAPTLSLYPGLENRIREVAAGKLVIGTPMRIYDLYPVIELITSSFLCALTVLLVTSVASTLLGDRRALLVAAILALATPLWSAVSRALWMHSPSVFLLACALWLLVHARAEPRYFLALGACMALAYMMRPTNGVSVLAVSVYVLLVWRRFLVYYLLAALPFACVYIGYNLSVYGKIFSHYSAPGRLFFHKQFGMALLGNWVSPARGLLIFSPVLVFGMLGLFRTIRQPLSRLCLTIITLHWLAVSMYPHWWGGYSFGPRFFSDAIPFFMYGVIQYFATGERMRLLEARGIVMAGLFVVSAAIHAKGACDWDTFWWNRDPLSVDTHPERIWDWRDLQFLR